MNENVTIKSPKRKRWIARLLVSALCILLASSLLFVGVVAENVNTLSYVMIDESVSNTKTMYALFYGDDGKYGLSELIYTPSGFYFNGYAYQYDQEFSSPLFNLTYMPLNDIWKTSSGWTFNLLNFGSNSRFFWVYYHCFFAANTIGNSSYIDCIVADCYSWSGYKVQSVVYDSDGNSVYSNIRMSFMEPFCYFDLDGYAFSMGLYANKSDTYLIYENGILHSVNDVYPHLMWDNGWHAVSQNANDFVLDLEDFIFANSVQGLGLPFSTYYHFYGAVMARSYRVTVNYKLLTYTLSSGVVSSANSEYPFDSNLSCNFVYMADPFSNGYYESIVGKGWIIQGFSSSRPSIKDAFSIYDIYATSSEYVPPESSEDTSDETTVEPLPESSDESSEDPNLTKVWRYDSYLDGTSSATVIGGADLTNAVRVEAFLGRFQSSPNNPDWDDSYYNLTLRVTNSDDTEDIYEYDFPAYGYFVGLDNSEMDVSDFTFPNVVGYWFDIPFENGGELYFASSSPGGNVFLYGYAMQLTVNFNSPQSSFDINFGRDNYYVVISNVGVPAETITFRNETVVRYKKFASSGNSAWYSPEEGTYATFRASDVLDPNIGLYAIRIETNVDNTLGFPTESFLESVSKWEEYLSRQEDKQDFLNSLAGDAYDQISIDPDTSEAYGDAVDTFSTIVNSEGGSVIFGFFRYMWSVHPLMSSMVSLVVSFAIVGFIVRKV